MPLSETVKIEVRPRALDLFCGAGGTSTGLYRAGFDITGVDIEPQKRYPFKFVLGDALEYCSTHGRKFDLIVAGPPCQLYSVTFYLSKGGYSDMVASTRKVLQATGKPYIIENVPGAPLINPIKLCGTMFGLRVIRHRLFECDPVLWWAPRPCQHEGKTAPLMWGDLVKAGHTGGSHLIKFKYITVAGNHFLKADAQEAMAIDWMTNKEMSQAIPPGYTEWLGKEMLKLI